MRITRARRRNTRANRLIFETSWFLAAVTTLIFAGCSTHSPAAQIHQKTPREPGYVLVIHGGSGVPERNEMTPERDAELRATLDLALRAGEQVLSTNGICTDAVTASIRVLEDSPLFNAGRGAALNRDGIAEMDSAIMEGSTRRAGAVAAVHRARNPIDAARAVMEQTPHVLLVGAGADAFIADHHLAEESPEYFITEPRRRQWEQWRREHSLRSATGPDAIHRQDRARLGTVGAVALDRHGNLAAGTSTGGLCGKLPGRVGDSPLIGAGTYADNASCAVSATGHGEFFIRVGVAHDIAARMTYQGMSLQDAADHVVRKTLVQIGGEGGIIAVDRKGHIAMPYNGDGLHRGFVREGGPRTVAIYEK